MAKAVLRCGKVRDMRALAAAGRHAWGADAKARKRRRPDAEYRALVYDPVEKTFHKLAPPPPPPPEPEPEPEPDGEEAPGRPLPPLVDYPNLFRAAKERMGARERAKTTLAMHLIVGVSPSWIEGDPRDPDNPAVRRLIQVVSEWVEHDFGQTPWAVRYDLDERGTGVVDILVSPTSVYRNGRGPERTWISTNAALQRLVDRYPPPEKEEGDDEEEEDHWSYAAAQTGWAKYAQRELDPAIKRGTPGAEHQSPERYGEDRDADWARLDVERQQVESAQADAEADRRAALDAQREAEKAEAQAAEQAAAWRTEYGQAIEARGAAERAAERLRSETDAAKTLRTTALEAQSEARDRQSAAELAEGKAQTAQTDAQGAARRARTEREQADQAQAASERARAAAAEASKEASQREAASAAAAAKATERLDEETAARAAATAARDQSEREYAAVDAAREGLAEEQAAAIALAEGWLAAAVGKRVGAS